MNLIMLKISDEKPLMMYHRRKRIVRPLNNCLKYQEIWREKEGSSSQG